MSTVSWEEAKRKARERREAAGLPVRSAQEKQSAMDRLTTEVTRGCCPAVHLTESKKEAVNLALHFYAEQQERAARITRHFERAREWGAVDDAEALHEAEKRSR